MNIKSKEGYVLVLSLMLVIVLVISSITLFSSTTHFTREITLEEVRYNRGYYALISALRFAAILLRDPENNLGFSSGTFDNFSTASLQPTDDLFDPFNDFCTNVGISLYDFTLTISEQGLSGPYEVSATYTYTYAH